MRKFIATLIVAVVLGTGFTVSADAANSGESQQVRVLKQKLRESRKDYRDLTRIYVETGNELIALKQRPPTYVGSTNANPSTFYRVSWVRGVVGSQVSVTSQPIYSETLLNDYLNTVVNNDPLTVAGSVVVETATNTLTWN